MKKIISLLLFSLLLTGCNQELNVSEVDVKKVNSALREIIEVTAAENGNYLIEGEKEKYVYLNRSNVTQGEKASVLGDYIAIVNGNTLKIDFSEEYTTDDSNKDVNHELLFKIKGGEDAYDTITITSDGEPTSFLSIIDMD